MSEPIPMWEDWRFWQIVVTGAMAFLGFTFGTWVKDWFDRRRDEARRDHEKALRDEESRAIAVAFRAELGSLISDAKVRLSVVERFRESRTDVSGVGAFDLPSYVVYANNTHRLGDLGEKVAELVVSVHGTADHIRHYIAVSLAVPYEGALTPDQLASFRRAFLKLTRITEAAHNALDAFLGDSERFPNLTDVPAEADPAGTDDEPAEPDPAPAP